MLQLSRPLTLRSSQLVAAEPIFSRETARSGLPNTDYRMLRNSVDVARVSSSQVGSQLASDKKLFATTVFACTTCASDRTNVNETFDLRLSLCTLPGSVTDVVTSELRLGFLKNMPPVQSLVNMTGNMLRGERAGLSCVALAMPICCTLSTSLRLQISTNLMDVRYAALQYVCVYSFDERMKTCTNHVNYRLATKTYSKLTNSYSVRSVVQT